MEITGAIFAPVTAARADRSAPARHPAGCSCSACSSKNGADGTGAGQSTAAGGAAGPSAAAAASGKPLTDDEQKQVAALKKRDDEVRRHEAAHLSAAGGNARGGAVFDYQTGPDGRRYAVGGHVDIDVSPVAGNPQATLAKMQQVQRAALAPADPSGQDRAVAAQAASAAAKAQQELAETNGPDQAGGPHRAGQAASAVPASGPPTNSPDPRPAAARFETPVESGRLLDVVG